MRGFGVYVASPYANAGFVRHVHEMLCEQGFYVTSTWAEQAQGAEDFARMTIEQLRAAATTNDRDLANANAVLAIDFNGSGRETYAEMRLALAWGRPVVFVGKPSLSAWRLGVVRVSGLDDAIAALMAMASLHASGHSGLALAALADAGSR